MTRFLSALVAAAALLAGGLPALAGPLHEAAETGDIDQVKQAIAEGADVNQADYASRLPLYLAASKGHAAIAVLLIEKGADVSMEYPLLRWRPLHAAAYAGHLDVVEILIEHGADVNAASRVTAKTPLHTAAEGGRLPIVELLIAKGADVNARDNVNTGPIHSAAASGHFDVVELLIAHGAPAPAEPMVTRGVFSVPVSRAEVGQGWNSRGYDCTSRLFLRGWASSNHSHRSDEVITAVEGGVALVVGEQRFEAEPGDELFLPSNTMHRLENSHDGRLEMLYGLKHAVGAPPNRCD
jgi:mannose-6-phosphate isomerase-like protein (cupin superfamily)